MELKKVAIIGRPNVGKSTFFNALVGKKTAIVSSIAGMTRDRNIKFGRISNLSFEIIDTAGVDCVTNSPLAAYMNEQSMKAIQDADVILFMTDAKENNLHAEMQIADWIKNTFNKINKNKPVILLANKSDTVSQENYELPLLGFGDPIYLSSVNKIGFSELYAKLLEHISSSESVKPQEETHMKLAVLGRPNVGKSTLINQILGEDRLITSSIAGTTRDSITTSITFDNRRIELIDTAGSRKNKKANSREEALAVKDTNKSVESANVIVLVIDSTAPFETRDLQLASYVIEQGKGLIIALNKCDLVKGTIAEFVRKCKNALGAKLTNHSEILPISAKSGKNVKTLLKKTLHIYDQWNTNISTKKLNDWLRATVSMNMPSTIDKKCPKLSFIKQVSSRPPSFVIFGTKIDLLKQSYAKFLENTLRKDFLLENVPIRFCIKYKNNPFKKK